LIFAHEAIFLNAVDHISVFDESGVYPFILVT
jgi:hypothetical protein